MAKIITAAELAEIVTKLLTTDEIDNAVAFNGFMETIAEAVVIVAGGTVGAITPPTADLPEWSVGITGGPREGIPEGGGVWAGYDPDGEL